MIHRLSVILKNSYKSSYKKGFIKYLDSLSYNEFKVMYMHYMKVHLRYEKRYKTEKPKFFSKKWFINKKILSNSIRLYYLFSNTKSKYIKKVMDELDIISNKRSNLLDRISITQAKIKNLSDKNIVLTQTPTQMDNIDFILLIVENIYLTEEITSLYNKLDDMGNDII